MAKAQVSRWADQSGYRIRPALAEAKLITAKRAQDAVYVATLSEELRDIEVMIDKLEENLPPDLAERREETSTIIAVDLDMVSRIRDKSCELERRLRRIEEFAPPSRALGRALERAHGNPTERRLRNDPKFSRLNAMRLLRAGTLRTVAVPPAAKTS